MSISVVRQMFESAMHEEPPPPTPDQERAMAAVVLMTTVPTDRALAGWCTFGTGSAVDWNDYVATPGRRMMDIVSGYVWT